MISLQQDLQPDLLSFDSSATQGKLACWCRDNTIAKKAAIKFYERKIEEDRALVGDMLGLKYQAGEFYYTIEPEQSKSTDEWVQANNI